MSTLRLAFVLCALCVSLAACSGDDADPVIVDEPGDGDGDGDGDTNGDGDGDGDTSGDGDGDGDGDTDDGGGVGGDCGVDATAPALPGVTLHVEGDACTFASGDEAEFRYTIEIDDPIAYEQPASVGCGTCGDSLVSFEIGDNGLVLYNLSDVGCCPPDEQEDKTLAAEPITGTIEWPGVQWRGPSDTSQPYGPAFPPGEYEVRVRINVPGIGAVLATLPITVEPKNAEQGRRPCMASVYVYPSGDATFPDPTSCNTCTCEDGVVTRCTEVGCPTPCPTGTAAGVDCGQCGATSMGCAIPRTACLPECGPSDACGGASCDDGVCKSLCD